MEYIKNAAKTTECIFCAYPGQNRDAENHILLRNQTCFAILNRFPYSNGHILVVPYRHTAELDDLSDDELLDLMRLTRRCKNLLQETTAPHGFNIGINIGQTAGAGITDHIHIHIVPRWSGDTNFMPAIGETKVIPQSLDETYRLLTEKIEREK